MTDADLCIYIAIGDADFYFDDDGEEQATVSNMINHPTVECSEPTPTCTGKPHVA